MRQDFLLFMNFYKSKDRLVSKQIGFLLDIVDNLFGIVDNLLTVLDDLLRITDNLLGIADNLLSIADNLLDTVDNLLGIVDNLLYIVDHRDTFITPVPLGLNSRRISELWIMEEGV